MLDIRVELTAYRDLTSELLALPPSQSDFVLTSSRPNSTPHAPFRHHTRIKSASLALPVSLSDIHPDPVAPRVYAFHSDTTHKPRPSCWRFVVSSGFHPGLLAPQLSTDTLLLKPLLGIITTAGLALPLSLSNYRSDIVAPPTSFEQKNAGLRQHSFISHVSQALPRLLSVTVRYLHHLQCHPSCPRFSCPQAFHSLCAEYFEQLGT